MIYNIENNPETAKLLQQTMPPNTKDFGWFLATVEEAISKKLQVELNFNNGNRAYGKMLSATVDYTPEKPENTTLSFEFESSGTGDKQTYKYEFNALLVEENQLSVPGEHMKYYIEDDSHSVIVGFVFKYR